MKQTLNQNLAMWHPSATSTPIKPIFSNNLGGYKQLQKQLVKPADVVKAFLGNKVNLSSFSSNGNLKTKDVKKQKKSHNNKTFKYFDVSSSEDEDCLDNIKLHDIKITVGKNSNHKSILGDKSNKAILQTQEGEKSNNSLLNSLNNHAENVLPQNKVIKSNSKKKLSQNKIINKSPRTVLQQSTNVKYENIMKNNFKKKIKSKVNNEEKTLSINLIETFKAQNKFSVSLKENKNNTNSNSVVKKQESHKSKCTVLKEKNQEILDSNSFQVMKSHTLKIPKLVSGKRKRNRKLTTAQKGNKKIYTIETNESLNEKSMSPLHIWSSKKKNMSHQLFSDSKEQELINSLDLTVPEPNEEICGASLLSDKNQGNNLKNSKTDNCKNTSVKIQRPSRQRKLPKQYWLPTDTPPDTVKPKKFRLFDPCQKNVEKITKSCENLTNENDKKDFQILTAKDKTETLKKGPEFDEKITSNFVSNPTIESNNEEHLIIEKKRGVKRKSPAATRNTRSKTKQTTQKIVPKESTSGSSNSQKPAKQTNIPDSDSFEIFKKMSALPFLESQPGCLASECVSLKGFKCGVLKVCKESEILSKTAHKKSYFGGMVVKNKLKMKIGTNELELEEGDMAFVPPLTQWSAKNETQIESIFYYWCFGLKS